MLSIRKDASLVRLILSVYVLVIRYLAIKEKIRYVETNQLNDDKNKLLLQAAIYSNIIAYFLSCKFSCHAKTKRLEPVGESCSIRDPFSRVVRQIKAPLRFFKAIIYQPRRNVV